MILKMTVLEIKKSNNSGIDINVEQLAQFMTKEFLTNIKKNKNKKKKLKKKFRKSENRERIENMTEDLESVEEKLNTKEEIKGKSITKFN